MGTGADPDKNIYLNLTAGSGGAAESFHMYRGEAGSSDFYQLFTSDYKIFTSDENVESDGLKGVSKRVNEIREKGSNDVDLTSGFPLYYLARKDYGYSSAWAKHSEFGFTVGKDSKIKANSMHLFGAGDRSTSSFSVVFGNVFRRCLSLSGYKQFKNKSNSKSGAKNCEIQVGPIYYYRDFDHYMLINCTHSGGSIRARVARKCSHGSNRTVGSKNELEMGKTKDQDPPVTGKLDIYFRGWFVT